jgi:N-acetylglutamate synthase-like GNAT family acetyltransferase
MHYTYQIGNRASMVDNITIVRETLPDFSNVQAFYVSVGYLGTITADCIVISAKTADAIVGAVRLAPENGLLVLRGMMVAPAYQRRGIGTRMLRQISELMSSYECFCLPHAWLEGFYGTIGFAKIEDHDAPPHLRERLVEGRRKYP